MPPTLFFCKGDKAWREKVPINLKNVLEFYRQSISDLQHKGNMVSIQVQTAQFGIGANPKTSRDVIREEDNTEAQPYWKQPPCRHYNPPNDIFGSTTLDDWCGTNHYVGVVQYSMYGHCNHGIQRYPFQGQRGNLRIYPNVFQREDLYCYRWKIWWS